MRFHLTLTSAGTCNVLPCNYQYPLSAAIYKIIQQADSRYSEFLHETGYQLASGKTFKLFTFSDIRTPFKIRGDRLVMSTSKAGVVVCFHIPRAAENFIKGLFIHHRLEIADQKSKAVFEVEQVETLPTVLDNQGEEKIISCSFQPISPVVCGKKEENQNYRFLAPGEERYNEMLLLNWQEKIRSVFGSDVQESDLLDLRIEAERYKNPPKSRLVTIKAGSPEETKIRGFMNFKINVIGKKKYIGLLLDTGMGLYNAMGMGGVQLARH